MSGKRLWLLAGLALLLAACGGGAPPQDLTLSGVTPDSPAVAQGGSLSLTLTLASQNGFQGQVSLSVTENGQPPSWLSLSPTSATLNVPKGGQAQVGLQVQVAGNAPTGPHALKLKVSYGDKAAERDLTLTVAPPPSFTLALGATSLALEQGGSSATPLTVTPQNGFTGTVSLALAAGQDQVPQGLSLSPGSVQVSGANPVTQTLTLSALSSTPTGTYRLKVRGTSGSLTKDVDLTVTVSAPSGGGGGGGGPTPSYDLALNPTTLTLQQGSSGQVSVSLTRQNFTGGVTLSLEGNAPLATSPAPDKIAWSFNPNPATGNSATLTLQVGQNVPAGNYALTVRGQAQGLQDRTASLTLTVQAAPVQGSGPSLTWTPVFPAYEVAYGNGVFVAVGEAVLVSSDGQSWEAVRLPQQPGCRLSQLSFVNGRFVAVDEGGGPFGCVFNNQVWESTDGRTWTPHPFSATPSSPKPSFLTRIVYKDGSYYAMGWVQGYILNQGYTRAGWLYASQDLTYWTKVGETGSLSDPSSQFVPYDLALGGDYFVAVGQNLGNQVGVALASQDGQTWSQVAAEGSELQRVAYGNGQFVAIGFRYGGGGAATASPPNNPTGSWTSLTPPDIPSYRYLGLGFDGTRFLAATEGKIWAYDGTTANPNYASLPRYIRNASGIAFAGGTYVFMGGDGFAVSLNLTDWTTGFDTNYPGPVAYGNGKFVLAVVDYPSTVFATAAEGPFPAWRVSDPTPRAGVDRLAFLNGGFIGVGQYGRVYLSSDGSSWSQVSTPTSQSLEGVAYGNGTYVAVGLNGAIVYSQSPDATSWNLASGTNGEDFEGVAYGNGKFVAVGGNAVYTSPDGANWTLQSGPQDYLRDVAFGNGKFVAVSSSEIYYSTDGASWQSLTPPPSPLLPNGTVELDRIVWTGSFLMAVGRVTNFTSDYAYIITSTDGQSWTVQDTPFQAHPHDVAVGNQYALVVYRYGALVGRLP